MYNKYIFINNNRRKKQKELLEKQENPQISFDMLTDDMEKQDVNKAVGEDVATNNFSNAQSKNTEINAKANNVIDNTANKVANGNSKTKNESMNSKIKNSAGNVITRSTKSSRSKNLNKFVDDYVLVDIETTGLSPANDDIIEIGAIKVENNKMVDTFNQLIRIDRSLPPFITNLTGITDEMLKTGKMPDEVFKEFVNFIGDSVIIGHNVNFDLGFLSNKCKKYLDYNLVNDYIDTLYLARRLVPHSVNYKLGTLANLFNVSYKGAHRGLKDVEITYEVYNRLREMR